MTEKMRFWLQVAEMSSDLEMEEGVCHSGRDQKRAGAAPPHLGEEPTEGIKEPKNPLGGLYILFSPGILERSGFVTNVCMYRCF